MALGNNLKRIKKDSLIPAKKDKKEKPKLKKLVSKTESKPKAPTPKVKATAKPKVTTKPAKEKKKVNTPKNKVVKKPISTTASKLPKEKPVSKPGATSKPSEIANLDENIILGGEDGSPLTVKLIPSRRKTVRKTKLIFEGSLSLIEAEAIKKCLLKTFKDYDVIDIQLINITHLDIIPIQLIQVFIGHYPDKKVKVDSDLPFDMKIIVERAGFGSLMFKEEAA